MLNDILVYVGAGAIFLWGLAHILVLRPVVSGFGTLSTPNSHIITMEWIAEGLSLCLVGVLAFLMATVGPPALAALVYRALAAFLVALAILSAFTGARTSVLPMKMCPIVKSGVALLFVVATFA